MICRELCYVDKECMKYDVKMEIIYICINKYWFIFINLRCNIDVG